jgi:phosphotriesterase-related protein
MKIRSVCGDIEPDLLGTTLIHEHVLVDVSCRAIEPSDAYFKEVAEAPVNPSVLYDLYRFPMISRDSLCMMDEQAAVEELRLYKNAGGTSLVDQTASTIGRDPLVLKRIAKETGLNIIASTGFYSPMLPEDFSGLSINQLADICIREINEGINGTNIPAGIIGEIGTSWPLTSEEEKSLRAAARAQVHTGAALSIHPYVWGRSALALLDILESEGADLNRVIVCHLDHELDVDYNKAIAARGACIEYDRCGIERYSGDIEKRLPRIFPRDLERVAAIQNLINSGYISQILISQDICQKIEQKKYGGPGYGHILRYFVPMMRLSGIPEEDINCLIVDNPRRLLAF